VVRSNDAFSDNTGSWVMVSGLSASVHASTKSLILVSFTAESDC
jgi:hypothetical protein